MAHTPPLQMTAIVLGTAELSDGTWAVSIATRTSMTLALPEHAADVEATTTCGHCGQAHPPGWATEAEAIAALGQIRDRIREQVEQRIPGGRIVDDTVTVPVKVTEQRLDGSN